MAKMFNVAQALEVGLMYPDQKPSNRLLSGQVGYLIAGMKSTKVMKSLNIGR